MNKTKRQNILTRGNLTKVMSQKLSTNNAQAKLLVDSIFTLMLESIVEDKSLKLVHFGTFSVQHKKARLGINFYTKQKAIIKAHQVVLFRPSLTLRNKVHYHNLTTLKQSK